MGEPRAAGDLKSRSGSREGQLTERTRPWARDSQSGQWCQLAPEPRAVLPQQEAAHQTQPYVALGVWAAVATCSLGSLLGVSRGPSRERWSTCLNGCDGQAWARSQELRAGLQHLGRPPLPSPRVSGDLDWKWSPSLRGIGATAKLFSKPPER